MEFYFKMRIFFDYIIPFASLGIVAIVWVLMYVVNKRADREKRINDKLREKREGSADENSD